MNSKRFTLNAEDGQKILTGFLVAIGGAGLTYLAGVVGQIDFAEWTPIIVALASVLVNAARKFIKTYE